MNLEEIINECVNLSESGDFHLERNSIDETWGASVDCFKGEEYISGKTPSEALEKLLIYLKNKQKATLQSD